MARRSSPRQAKPFVLQPTSCSEDFRYAIVDIANFFCRVGKVGLILDQFELQQDGALEGGKIVVRHHGQDRASVGSPMDADLAAISNYVIGHFGGKIGHVTPETVGLRRM